MAGHGERRRGSGQDEIYDTHYSQIAVVRGANGLAADLHEFQLTTAGTRHPYDYFHVNSIQQDTDGNLIVSGRNTWAAYKIDHTTGAVIWRLGGKLELPDGTRHAVRLPA